MGVSQPFTELSLLCFQMKGLDLDSGFDRGKGFHLVQTCIEGQLGRQELNRPAAGKSTVGSTVGLLPASVSPPLSLLGPHQQKLKLSLGQSLRALDYCQRATAHLPS